MTEWILIISLWEMRSGRYQEAEVPKAVFSSPVACGDFASNLLKKHPSPDGFVVLYKCRPRG